MKAIRLSVKQQISWAAKPIDAAITAVIRRKVTSEKIYDGSFIYDLRMLVKLGAGSTQGVRRGMLFNMSGIKSDETFEIVKVSANSSTGIDRSAIG